MPGESWGVTGSVGLRVSAVLGSWPAARLASRCSGLGRVLCLDLAFPSARFPVPRRAGMRLVRAGSCGQCLPIASAARLSTGSGASSIVMSTFAPVTLIVVSPLARRARVGSAWRRGGHDARLQRLSKRRDRVVLGHGRIPPDGDARRRRRAHPEDAQRRQPRRLHSSQYGLWSVQCHVHGEGKQPK